jgi:hypothetical protein
VRGGLAAGAWVALDFLLAPDTALAGRTPLQTLHAGDWDAVLCLVREDGPHPKARLRRSQPIETAIDP